jgi:hypothetical protein
MTRLPLGAIVAFFVFFMQRSNVEAVVRRPRITSDPRS